MARRILALLIAACCLAACKQKTDCCTIGGINKGSVIAVCEGQYGSGNSAATIYDPAGGYTRGDIYNDANGHSIGDVFQSLYKVSSTQYLAVVNNSDRIAILNQNFLETGSIAIPKPRYIMQVSETKAYVSTLYSNKVYIINPQSGAVRGSVNMPFQNPEGMALAGGRVYVATWDVAAEDIYPIDTATDVIGSAIHIDGHAPQEILRDKEGLLWVLSGNDAKGVQSVLTRVSPADGSILKTYYFGAADALRPTFNNTRDTLYFIEVNYSGGSANNGIYRLGIHQDGLPGSAFVAASGLQYFWGVGVHPTSGNIYVADPKGFTQRGMVRIYQPGGKVVDSFETGVGPGHFYFEQ